MDFRGKMVGNGFPRVSRHGHRGSPVDNGQNGGKWWKMGCRGYLVGNGFPRVSRHSPTTHLPNRNHEYCILHTIAIIYITNQSIPTVFAILSSIVVKQDKSPFD